jgi:hypothetical protein
MPLLDHFNPPLSRTHPWRSFHGAWAAAMARLLNGGVLPDGYYAAPLLESSIQNDEPDAAPEWIPPQPVLTVSVDLPMDDTVGVHVYRKDGDPLLTAVIELVGLCTKLRLQGRQAFAVKCAGYLQRRLSLVIVDTVTPLQSDLNASIMPLLGLDPVKVLPLGYGAVSYQVEGRKKGAQTLLLWPAPLALGEPLPTLPLWIAADFSVPLDLEASYRAACEDLRIRQAG